MSVIDCDYLPGDKVVFPSALALQIMKASAVATAFEEQALTCSPRTQGVRLLKVWCLDTSGKCGCRP